MLLIQQIHIEKAKDEDAAAVQCVPGCNLFFASLVTNLIYLCLKKCYFTPWASFIIHHSQNQWNLNCECSYSKLTFTHPFYSCPIYRVSFLPPTPLYTGSGAQGRAEDDEDDDDVGGSETEIVMWLENYYFLKWNAFLAPLFGEGWTITEYFFLWHAFCNREDTFHFDILTYYFLSLSLALKGTRKKCQ